MNILERVIIGVIGVLSLASCQTEQEVLLHDISVALQERLNNGELPKTTRESRQVREVIFDGKIGTYDAHVIVGPGYGTDGLGKVEKLLDSFYLIAESMWGSDFWHVLEFEFDKWQIEKDYCGFRVGWWSLPRTNLNTYDSYDSNLASGYSTFHSFSDYKKGDSIEVDRITIYNSQNQGIATIEQCKQESAIAAELVDLALREFNRYSISVLAIDVPLYRLGMKNY